MPLTFLDPILPNLSLLMPEVMLALSVLILLLIGVIRGERDAGAVAMLGMLVLSVALYTTAMGQGSGLLFEGLVQVDAFTQAAKFLVLLGALAALGLSLPQFQEAQQSTATRFDDVEYDGTDRRGLGRVAPHRLALTPRFEYPLLVLLAVLGLLLMVSANDLMSFYMGLELASLAQYILASFNRDDVRSSEAGLKYFVLGALASGLLLFGSGLIYGFTGTTNFTVLADLLADMNTARDASAGLIIGLVLVITALCFKVSAVPFHMWTPDVYQGAPTPVTAFFAIAPKVAALALFTRFLVGPFGELAGQWQQVIVFVSIASMLVGALAALSQTNLKRLLAYSSIGHVGYALMGLAANSAAGVAALLFYLALYLLASAGAFAVLLGMRRKGAYVEDIDALAGLARTHPRMALAFAVFLFSMAGIPPLAGFFGKFYVFGAALEAGFVTLAIVGVLSSVIGAYYYLRLVKIMYMDDARSPLDADVAVVPRVIMGVTAVVSFLFFVFPTPLLVWSETAARALFG